MAKKPASEPKVTKEHADGAGGSAHMFIIAGEEAFLRSAATSDLRKRLEKLHGEVDVVNFEGSTASAAEVLDECRSFGLIARHKLVIVDESESLVKEDVRPLFERYAEVPIESATLVLRSKSFKSTSRLEKALSARGAVVLCESLNDADAIKWVTKHAKQDIGMPIDDDAARALVHRVGPSLMHLHSELGKLAAAAGEAKTISIKLVAEFVGVSREEEAWNIQRTLLSGNAPQALAHLRHVLDVSRQPAPLVMYAVTDLARKLHGLSAGLKSGRNASELNKPLKIWGPSTDALYEVARRMHPMRTLGFLRACVKADERSKTGFTDADRSLEMLVVRLQRMLN